MELASNRSDGPCVTPPQLLKPGQDDTLSINELVEESDPDERLKALNKLWLSFYHKAKGKDEKPEPKPEPKPAERRWKLLRQKMIQIQTMMIHSCQLKRKLNWPERTSTTRSVESAESLSGLLIDSIKSERLRTGDIRRSEIVAKAEAISQLRDESLFETQGSSESNVMASGTVNKTGYAVPPPAALVQFSRTASFSNWQTGVQFPVRHALSKGRKEMRMENIENAMGAV